MELSANYIKRIEIDGLWDRFNIVWDLRPDVNILSGINGVGKTTILNRSVGYLEQLSGEVRVMKKTEYISFSTIPKLLTFLMMLSVVTIVRLLWGISQLVWQIRM
jgi:ABC-type Mn2+/Zn2+ transport system ATPase subunit